jgi:ribosome-associated toxin RatA of RatAB toxin-antitoxin module
MTTLHNEVIIDAPIEKIWDVLSKVDELDKYDPTVMKSKAISEISSGIGAARKVDMKDGKNWFEEKCTISKPNESIAYELTACSFPVHQLKHTYSFEKIGVIDGNRIEFVVDGENYEWLSGVPILPNGGTWNLWVLRDKDYTPLFGSEKTITQGLSVFQKLDRIVNLGGGDEQVRFKAGTMIPKMPNPPANKSRVVVPPRVMIGGADTMENLLPKGP